MDIFILTILTQSLKETKIKHVNNVTTLVIFFYHFKKQNTAPSTSSSKVQWKLVLGSWWTHLLLTDRQNFIGKNITNLSDRCVMVFSAPLCI